MELLLVRIDHFHDRKQYVSVLREWLQELGVADGRVISVGALHLLFIAARADQNTRLLELYRTRDIDTNSRDEPCIDKFIDVLGRKAVGKSSCKGFLEMNILSKDLLQKVLVHEWQAEQAWLDTAQATTRTKAFLQWRDAAKAARKERRKRVGLNKQKERDAKRLKREQEQAEQEQAEQEQAEQEQEEEQEEEEKEQAEPSHPKDKLEDVTAQDTVETEQVDKEKEPHKEPRKELSPAASSSKKGKKSKKRRGKAKAAPPAPSAT